VPPDGERRRRGRPKAAALARVRRVAAESKVARVRKEGKAGVAAVSL
jgi:hypothetical protein